MPSMRVACPLAAFGGSIRPWYNLTNHLFIIKIMDILYLLHECRCIVNEVEGVIKVSRNQLKWHYLVQVYIHSMSLQVAGVNATVAEGHQRSSTEISASLLVEGVRLVQRTVVAGRLRTSTEK